MPFSDTPIEIGYLGMGWLNHTTHTKSAAVYQTGCLP